MRTAVLLSALLFAFVAVAYGEETETVPEIVEEEGGIIAEDDDATKKGFYGGGGHSDSDSGSGYGSSKHGSDSDSGSHRFDCEKKINKAMFRIHKCESAASKIQAELSEAHKKIDHVEKELAACKDKKTCAEITDELLTTFNGAVKDAYKCIEGAFDKSGHSSSDSSDDDYDKDSYDKGSY